MTGLDSGAFIMHTYPPSQLPQTPAGRMEFVAELLYGIPVVSVCSCGCGMETDTGRREPLITKADAERLLEAI